MYYPGVISSEKLKVINGKYSVVGDSPGTEEWAEFLYTDVNKYPLEPNSTYWVSFSYKIHRSSAKSEFYFLARDLGGAGDEGLSKWKGEEGRILNMEVTMTTGNSENYYFIWGINGRGSISIDDVQITKS
ncbi:hypothetical protein GC101_10530 [Paenibacillus sp. LMG 31459]|uniref:CBM-cenC domain-containing protein n=1 Tax=Paenibacillus phytohabitans TaxID=2654978 RepID=A0ABX1YEA8_9BACL|nr:hypothetical protein [Paenibacillus phytohabitans]NOU79317.1 hypothetical protein [Paenibacillus phytohabitans]